MQKQNRNAGGHEEGNLYVKPWNDATSARRRLSHWPLGTGELRLRRSRARTQTLSAAHCLHNLASELDLKKDLLMDHSNDPIISPLKWYYKEAV